MFFGSKNNAEKTEPKKLFVIEHDFADGEIAYKYEREHIPLGSVLFVKPGQEVVAVVEGKPTTFINGRYDENALRSNNLIGTTEKLSRPYEDQIYNTYLIFINKDKAVKCLWGTTSPIVFYSQKYESNFKVRARGSYTVIVNNSTKFLFELLGQLHSYTVKDIDNFLFQEVVQIVMSYISSVLQQDAIPFTQLTSHTAEISQKVTKALKDNEVFENYGLRLKSGLAIEYMALDDEDLKAVQEADAQVRSAEMSKRATIKEGEGQASVTRAVGYAEADVMHAKGDKYAQQRMYDVLQSAAENEGGNSNLMTAGIGLGMGAGLGGGFGYAMGDMAMGAFAGAGNYSHTQQYTQAGQTGQTPCPDCGTMNIVGAKFCQGCGKKFAAEITCPDCGALNAAGAKFCQGCGKKLTAEITCPECGTSNAAGAKFCQSCGKKLIAEIVCPDCGTTNESGVKFCKNCGKNLVE